MRKILYTFVGFCFFACGQQNSNIMIEDKIKSLKNFDYEPIYQVHVETPYSFTIFINGIPIANKNVNYLSDYLTEINSCIPNSGKQSIEISIYPRYTEVNKQNEFMENDVPFFLTIEKTNWQNGSLTKPEIVFQYQLPNQDYTALKKITHISDFTADVPYSLTDWKNGQTIDVKDSVSIKTKLLETYKTLKNNFENQEGKKYVNNVGLGLYNLYQSSYFSQDEALNHLKYKVDFINNKRRELLNFENYKLEISGNSKLISLRRIDGYNNQEGILRRVYNKGTKKMVQIDDIVFYSPTKDKYEIFWFNNVVKGLKP